MVAPRHQLRDYQAGAVTNVLAALAELSLAGRVELAPGNLAIGL